MDPLCPKCANAMIQYERNGVRIDQCTECKGIFLDRGELDRLIAAESSWHHPDQPRPAGYRDHGDTKHHDDDDDDDDDDHRHGQRGQHDQRGQRGKKRRARSFLEDLFES